MFEANSKGSRGEGWRIRDEVMRDEGLGTRDKE